MLKPFSVLRFSLILLMIITVFPELNAQPSDLLWLTKRGKTIRSYYQGSQIELVTTRGVYKNAVITRLYKDTLYLKESLVRTVMTQFGFYVTDTAGSYSYTYHYKDIASIGKKKSGFNLQGSGAALVGGGLLLTLASGVVYLADSDSFSPELLKAAVGLAGLGYLIMKLSGQAIVIGKRGYRMEYISLSPSTNAVEYPK